MTKAEATQKIKEAGVTKRMTAYSEPETGDIIVNVRKPMKIENGKGKGSIIDLYTPKSFRVWTSRKNIVSRLKKTRGVKVRMLDGEAEVIIPGHLADELLPKFGARVKQTRSAESIARSTQNLKKWRESQKGVKK